MTKASFKRWAYRAWVLFLLPFLVAFFFGFLLVDILQVSYRAIRDELGPPFGEVYRDLPEVFRDHWTRY